MGSTGSPSAPRGIVFPALDAQAFSASKPTLFGLAGVLWRKFVAMGAMGKIALLEAAGGNGLANAPFAVSAPGLDDLVIGQASGDAGNNGVCFDPSDFRQFNGKILNTRYDNIAVVSHVPGLRLSRRPTAIVWAIAPIDIDPVNGRSFRPWPHVLCKFGKIIPNWIDGYTSPPVSVILGVIGIVASLTHIPPSLVKRMRVSERHNRPSMETAMHLTPFNQEHNGEKRYAA